jgi:alpha-beta hydrolase superfamily lysophospholipase
VKHLVLVEGAGHALHLDQKKDEVYRAVAGWIGQYLQ